MEQDNSASGGVRLAPRPGPGRPAPGGARHRGWIGWLALAAVVAAGLIGAAYEGLPSGGRATTISPAAGGEASSGSALKTTAINGVVVLTNAEGLTVYSFAPDTPSMSNCNGSCAAYWPPLTGAPRAGPGVTGRLGTITRPGGTTQATYDGHPLYTYVGDTQPGQANGNNLNLNGGLWHEVTVTR